MRRSVAAWRLRAVLIGMLGLLLLGPLQAVSQQPPTVEELDARIAKVQKELADAQARAERLANDETKQLAYLKELETQITKGQELINAYGTDIERLNGRVGVLQAEIRRLDGEIVVLNDAVSDYVVTLYKHGRERMYEAVLSSRSFTQAVRRLRGVMAVAERQHSDVEDLASTRKEKDDARTEVMGNLTAVQQRRQASQRRQRELNQTRQKTSALLTSIKQDKQKVQQAIEEAQKEIDKMVAEKMEAIRRLEARGLGNVTLGGFGKTKGNLLWPLGGRRGTGRIVRGFGRQTGVDRTTVTSPGIDIIAPDDRTSIVAVHNGQVIDLRWIGMLGWVITLNHGDGFATVYVNCENVGIAQGDPVPAGWVMGVVGDALPAAADEPAGNILRFMLYSGNKAQDPVPWLGGGGM